MAGNEVERQRQAVSPGHGLPLQPRRQPSSKCSAGTSATTTKSPSIRFGTIWQSDNDDDGNKGVRINYVMEYGNYGYTDEMTGAGWQTPRTNMENGDSAAALASERSGRRAECCCTGRARRRASASTKARCCRKSSATR